MVGAGELKHRITILKPTWSDNVVGEATVTYSSVTSVWAAILPLTHKVISEYKKARLEATMTIRIRYVDWLTEDHRICWKDKHYSIEGIVDFENRHEDLTISVKLVEDTDGTA